MWRHGNYNHSRKIPVCIVLKEKCLIWNCFFFTEDMSEEIHSGWLTKSPGSKKVTIFANNITLPIKAVSCSINPHFDKHSKASAKGTRSTRNVYSFVISAIGSSFLKKYKRFAINQEAFRLAKCLSLILWFANKHLACSCIFKLLEFILEKLKYFWLMWSQRKIFTLCCLWAPGNRLGIGE